MRRDPENWGTRALEKHLPKNVAYSVPMMGDRHGGNLVDTSRNRQLAQRKLDEKYLTPPFHFSPFAVIKYR